MGVNVKTGDVMTSIAYRITEACERKEAEMRYAVRSGRMSLDDFLVKYKGIKPQHIPMVRQRFHEAIYG